MPRLTVVIPNYNGEKYIEGCLNSLNKQTMTDYELIIVDNASVDGSMDIINNMCHKADILQLDKNYGFAHAVNVGIEAACCEYVLLLNNDTEADEDFLENMLAAIERSPKIFSVSARMVQMYNHSLIDSAGDLYCGLGWAYSRGKDSPVCDYNKSSRIFSSCGGAAIYRRSLLLELGMFDVLHSSYLEDVDIGYRARINGYVNVYEPKAIVYHAGSGVTGSRHNDFKVRLSARNSILLIYKNMPDLQIVMNLPLLIAGYIIKCGFFIKKGLGGAYIKGVFDGLCMCDKACRVPFKKRNLLNYLVIQIELLINIYKRFFGDV